MKMWTWKFGNTYIDVEFGWPWKMWKFGLMTSLHSWAQYRDLMIGFGFIFFHIWYHPEIY